MGAYLLACISVVAGCTHFPSLGDGRALAGASVRVETLPGYEERGEVVKHQGGVLIRTERGDFEVHEVRKITRIKRLRGGLEGFGWGLLVGAVGGAVIGYAGRDRPSAIAGTTGEHVFVGSVSLGLVGGIIGLVVGTVRGSRDVYSISGTPPSQTRMGRQRPARWSASDEDRSMLRGEHTFVRGRP